MQSNIEDKTAQNGTPDEACCCDHAAADAAPVTGEMIKEAFERLQDMTKRCETPVILHALIKLSDSVAQLNVTNDAVTQAVGEKAIKWMATRGFLLASGACISGDADAVSQGIKFLFDEDKKDDVMRSALKGMMEKLGTN